MPKLQRMLRGVREIVSALAALAAYLFTVLPPTRRELSRWRLRAAAIPDPGLRSRALAALGQKSLNVEAVAVFATLSPRRSRPAVVRAIAALQIAIDYLDSVDEAEGGSLERSLELHRPLTEPGSPLDDGGYLDALLDAWIAATEEAALNDSFPPLVRRAAGRCGEGQSHTHAAAREPAALEEWARRLDPEGSGRWWETAAGASSSVAAHALIAAAADPGADRRTATLVDAAYFPTIGALTVLLDDLVDLDEDAAKGEHNYVGYYASGGEAAARMGKIAAEAEAAIAVLPRRRRHAAILAGVAGFYLSDPAAATPFARPIADRLTATLGPATKLLAAFMGLRRRVR